MESLTQKIGKYLEKYLQVFLVEGKVDDAEDFFSFYENIKSTSREEQIQRLSKIDNLHLISIADMGYGANFALPIAKQNKTSNVEIQDPGPDLDHRVDFHDFFFNGYSKITLEKNTDYNQNDPEGSLNKLFYNNGIKNVKFKKIAADKNTLSVDSPELVYHAERVNDLTQLLVEATNENNTGLVLQPFINPSLRIRRYDDSHIENINYNYWPLTQNRSEGTSLNESWSRLITSCQMYYASKLADEIGGDVMQNTDHQGVHYKRPMFYVIK